MTRMLMAFNAALTFGRSLNTLVSMASDRELEADQEVINKRILDFVLQYNPDWGQTALNEWRHRYGAEIEVKQLAFELRDFQERARDESWSHQDALDRLHKLSMKYDLDTSEQRYQSIHLGLRTLVHPPAPSPAPPPPPGERATRREAHSGRSSPLAESCDTTGSGT